VTLPSSAVFNHISEKTCRTIGQSLSFRVFGPLVTLPSSGACSCISDTTIQLPTPSRRCPLRRGTCLLRNCSCLLRRCSCLLRRRSCRLRRCSCPGACIVCLEGIGELLARASQDPPPGSRKPMTGLGWLQLPCGHKFLAECTEHRQETKGLCPTRRRNIRSLATCAQMLLWGLAVAAPGSDPAEDASLSMSSLTSSLENTSSMQLHTPGSLFVHKMSFTHLHCLVACFH